MYKYETIVDEILKRFPTFADSDERKEIYDNDGPYIYFSYFGDFLLREMNRSGVESEVIKKAFAFIDKIFESSDLDSKLWDLFNLELFDRFRMQEKYTSIANKYLTGKALKAFQDREGRPAA